MEILVWFVVAETALFMLILPLRISLKASVSLGAERVVLTIKIWSVHVVNISLKKKKDVLRLSINGKIREKSSKTRSLKRTEYNSPRNLRKIPKEIYHLIEVIDVFAIVGGQDALSAGINWGIVSNGILNLQPKINRNLIVPNFQDDVFIVNCEIKFRLAIIDILKLIGAYGIKRNFKANNRQFERSDQC